MDIVRLNAAAAAASIGLALGGAMPASAADVYETPPWSPSWYATLLGGVALPGELDSVDSPTVGGGPGSAITGSTDFDTGFAVTGAIGTYFSNRFRGEILVGYSDQDPDRFVGTFTPGPVAIDTAVDGSVSTIRVMAIAAYDFDINMPRVTPYVAAGAGFIHINADDITLAGFAGGIDDEATVVAAQIGAGVAFHLTPRVDLLVDYAAIFGADADLTWVAPGGTSTVTTEVRGHTVQGGFRFRF